MALTISRFRGVVNGKELKDYNYKLDYTIDNIEDRLELVKNIFNIDEVGSKEELWQEIWDMACCKAGLNKNDALWSETDVSILLENVGTYLLAVSKEENKDKKIVTYDSYKMFQRALQEESVLNRVGENNREEFAVFKVSKNFKLAPKKAVNKADVERNSIIKDYDNYREYLMMLQKDKDKRRELASILKKKNFKTDEHKIARVVKRQLALVKDDMLFVKESELRPITWKSPLKDSGNEIDWDYLDLLDPVHVKALLAVPKDIDISMDINVTVDSILEDVVLTSRQEEILKLWRKDKTQEYIAKELEIDQADVSRNLDRAVKKFIETYEKQYAEKYYYLNVVKGKYKTCSKCGEVKLLQEFNKNARRKDGHENMCREC